MPVTVGLRLQARPGEAATLLALGEAADRGAMQRRELRAVCAGQGLADQNLVLVLGRWASRDAYWSARAQNEIGAALAALCTSPPVRYFFQDLTSSENLTRPAAVSCVFLAIPPTRGAEVEHWLLDEMREVALAVPGLVAHRVYRDEDDARHYLVLHGWASELDLQHSRAGTDARITARAHEVGAHPELFAGRIVANVDGDASI